MISGLCPRIDLSSDEPAINFNPFPSHHTKHRLVLTTLSTHKNPKTVSLFSTLHQHDDATAHLFVFVHGIVCIFYVEFPNFRTTDMQFGWRRIWKRVRINTSLRLYDDWGPVR